MCSQLARTATRRCAIGDHLERVMQSLQSEAPMERKAITCPLTGHLEQLVDDQRADRVLVLYAGGARARDPAGALADALRDDALVVEVADADCRGLPPPEDYDAVAIVAPLRAWGYPLATTQYLRAHTESLRAIPTWLVSLSSSGDASATRLWREVVPRRIMPALPIEGRMKQIGRLIADDM